MNNLLLRLLLAGSLAVLALAPVAAFAQDHGDEEATEEHAEGEGGTEAQSENSSSFIGGPDWTDAVR